MHEGDNRFDSTRSVCIPLLVIHVIEATLQNEGVDIHHIIKRMQFITHAFAQERSMCLINHRVGRLYK